MDELDLSALDRKVSLSEKTRILCRIVQRRFAPVIRIAVAVYDAETDELASFLDSDLDHPPLAHYRAPLAEVPGLLQIVRSGRPRVIRDMRALAASGHEHTVRLLHAGYQSSYTMSIIFNDVFYGVIFFNANETDNFSDEVVGHIDPLGRLLGLLVVKELRAIDRLAAATKTIQHIATRRDGETGAHLERMSRYSRLIAREIADRHGLSDDNIEHLFLFAPLHDIGKIAVPDRILLKPGRLSEEEYATMKTHAKKGVDIIDYMLAEFDLDALPSVGILRNVIHHHHEAVDGSGYPDGLSGADIPIEARIVTTADIFDALTSERPYKHAWSNEDAFAELEHMAGKRLDADCVEALLKHRDEVVDLQRRFRETVYG